MREGGQEPVLWARHVVGCLWPGAVDVNNPAAIIFRAMNARLKGRVRIVGGDFDS